MSTPRSKLIYLIGFMGSGKTTLGKAVAARAHLPFSDLDDMIEAAAGLTIREIFARDGEDGFRRLERRVLEEVASRGDAAIVACGGGTPCFFDNINLLNASGTTVWLDASPRRLHERLSLMSANRPLIAGKSPDELRDFIALALNKRNPFYSKASHRFDADSLDTAEQLSASVDAFINRFIADK